jgi:N6-adenosine-specific RNA methylase IME4
MKNPFAKLKRNHYGAILIDAPIPFKTWSPKGEGRSPQHHYDCMLPEELTALPVADLAAEGAFLFSWVPLRSVFLAEPLMCAWGFNFSGAAFSWVKLNPKKLTPFMGGGYGTRHNVEVCWLGRRGEPRRKSAGVRELIEAPVREHSRKPDETYERIEEFCDGPYCELFARQTRKGWDSWGDEVTKFNTEKARP